MESILKVNILKSNDYWTYSCCSFLRRCVTLIYKDNTLWNKVKLVIIGTLIIIFVSFLFSYIKTIFTISSTNTSHINDGIDQNLLRLIIPLFISPILEEYIFRKWLPSAFDDIFGRRNIIILSNILFAFFHFDVFFVPYFVNGLIYSYFYEKTSDIRISIAIHIIYNYFVFILTFH
ncbi:CPBP family intramembrane glutamic endopeptidase [Caldibacillus thermoamylovorans]|uniref:CPBP family glutamic-type intramembrane protease n=1 Tax=Caldibacillus thermoamylovorans TaxID=35841 RepID=UPI0009E2D6B3